MEKVLNTKKVQGLMKMELPVQPPGVQDLIQQPASVVTLHLHSITSMLRPIRRASKFKSINQQLKVRASNARVLTAPRRHRPTQQAALVSLSLLPTSSPAGPRPRHLVDHLRVKERPQPAPALRPLGPDQLRQ